MRLLKTKSELREFTREARRDGGTLGLVPTMGALHRGHLELVRRALAENQSVIVSIFINPTQFDKAEDLAKYPRTLEADMEALGKVDPGLAVFAPDISEMYPERVDADRYDFDGLDRVMEGAHRQGHFDGVGTIVETLLRLVGPDRAYFGEKDYQQLQIIRKLVETREIPVEIIPCPIVREADGLAMSSRNTRLPGPLRQQAPFLYATLQAARALFGTKSAMKVKEYVRAQFADHPDFSLEYIEIADARTLKPVSRKQAGKKYRAFAAAYLGGVRLIDNIALN
ncbi:pantoate--beta-alanine ligase [Robiginitalea sp. M366]|uniref:pantoate--beta-alanine ligase n=1 Tax=Robiginitalea aestuariiviva TaxID=3036903 RepID=UPI00240DBEB8|nr:pantoate--beta-alanine ligase [Robiginitalea aestuariiviva]MDG1571692.1 pantoate--beta-alanine ligase [Robiginitalea aestuariiviva]